MKTISYVLSVFLLSACSFLKEKEEMPVVDITSDQVSNIMVSEVADRIEYVCLELVKDCMLSDWTSYYLIDDVIIAVDREIFLFDKKTGKYHGKISKVGQGPNEYLSTSGSTFYGGFNTVTADRGNHWIEYDYKKGECSLIRKPDVSQFMKFSSNDDANKELSQFVIPVLYTVKLDTNLYAGYLHNIDGRNPYKMLYYNKSGVVVKQISNYLMFEDNPDNIAQYTPSFYLYRGENYFKELFNDTVFVVNKTGITSAFVLNAGSCSAPYEKQDVLDDFSAYKLIKLIGESDQNLFLSYDYAGKKYVGVMNKETRNVKVSVDGITDDLNCSFSLTPQYIYGKEMLCVLPAMLISEWIESNKDINLSFPENLKLIQEDANPVIAIVTLK